MENFIFKKSFGQNFLNDHNIISNIVRESNILPNSLVIEIGPGSGNLTREIACVAKHVLCYEIDTRLEEILDSNLDEFRNITIIYDDFLSRNICDDIKDFEYDNIYVVANLPYYITTPIIIKFITDQILVDKLVVMVQKEVGDRFKAVPNTKEYNSLSVYLNYYFDVKKVLDISKNVFLPKPNVDSIVVEFTRKDNKYELNNPDLFFKLVKDAFTQKRKTIKNNLKNYDLCKVEEVLNKYGFDLTSRAEQLPIEVFVDISNNLKG